MHCLPSSPFQVQKQQLQQPAVLQCLQRVTITYTFTAALLLLDQSFLMTFGVIAIAHTRVLLQGSSQQQLRAGLFTARTDTWH